MPEDVCDMPALGMAVGMMIFIAAIISYVIASVAAYAMLRPPRERKSFKS